MERWKAYLAFYEAHTSQGLACRTWCTVFGIRWGNSFISDLLPLSQTCPGSQFRKEFHVKGNQDEARVEMNFPEHPYLSLLHIHHLHDSAAPLSSRLLARLSCWGTICMISHFVQLIKTLGRLAVVGVSHSARRWSAAPSASSSHSFSPPSLPFNVYLIK